MRPISRTEYALKALAAYLLLAFWYLAVRTVLTLIGV